jgi:O-antigen ligase
MYNKASNYKYNIWVESAIFLVFLLSFYLSYVRYVFYSYDNMLIILGSGILMMLLFYIFHVGGFRYNWSSVEVLLWIVFHFYMLIVGVFFSKDFDYQHGLWVTISKYQVLFISVYLISIIKKNIDWFSYIIVITNIFIVITLIYNPVEYRGLGRLTLSEALNPNNLGMWLSFAIWSVLFLIGRNKIKGLYGGIIISLFTYGIFFTGSRKSLLAAVLMIVLWIVLCHFYDPRRRNIMSRYIYPIIIGYVALLVLSPYYYNSALSDRMQNLGNEIVSGGGRWALYKYGFEYFLESPIFGVGYGGYRVLFGRFYSHSTIVEIIVSGGLIGAIIYFSIYVILLIKLLKLSFYSHYKKINKYIIIDHRAVFILLLTMLFYSTVIIHPYDLNSMAVLGLIMGMVTYSSNKNNLITY